MRAALGRAPALATLFWSGNSWACTSVGWGTAEAEMARWPSPAVGAQTYRRVQTRPAHRSAHPNHRRPRPAIRPLSGASPQD
ncbi:hypothetical protein B0H11DRAFT_1979883 [Mycena galericulata]|nr:hypothetical protein B0H11DRAFT_1979883 [Mycena galericulata]